MTTRMALWGDVKKAFKLEHEYELSELRLNFTLHGEILEKLFPESSVHWDTFPAWINYYLKISCPLAWGRQVVKNDEMRLTAYECQDNTMMLKRDPSTARRAYSGDCIKAYYTGPIDKWMREPYAKRIVGKEGQLIIDDPHSDE